jgi:two-component system, cell cycle response regulator DivK
MSDERKTIVCIEDNASNMLLVSRIVEVEGHKLLQAEDGHSAIELLNNCDPDIILLDINIPGISGLDLARMIRQSERLASVPVIATTANVLVGDKERCIEAGCDDYLPKPLDIRRLREMLRYYIQNGRGNGDGSGMESDQSW